MPFDPDAVWSAACEVPPIAHLLKQRLAHRWVRFYSLPDGKRYADTAAEWEELLQRADTLVGDACRPGEELMLLTGLFGEAGSAPSRDPLLEVVQPDAEYWCELMPDDADEDDWPLHLWVSWPTYTPRGFDALVREAAVFNAVGVILVAVGNQVVIHPYDGGTDVLLPTARERDLWLARHREWASPLPSGL